MNKVKYFVLIVILLAACSSPSTRVVRATATDWVWGVEELASGAARVWLRHDNLAGYCTTDIQLVAQVKEMEGKLVRIEFVSRKYADGESWGATGCSRLATGAESSTPIFKLTGISRVIE